MIGRHAGFGGRVCVSLYSPRGIPTIFLSIDVNFQDFVTPLKSTYIEGFLVFLNADWKKISGIAIRYAEN